MEEKRDVALAHYENLGDKEKAEIHNDFKRETANGGVSEYIKRKYKLYSEEVDTWLQTCKGYEQGSLDLNDFITIKYIMENAPTPRCDGCSSLIVKAYFGCWDCYIDPYYEGTYDLCTGCYRSKKFKDHKHQTFKNGQTIQYMATLHLTEEIRYRDALLNEFKQRSTESAEEEKKSTESGVTSLPETQGVHRRIDLLGENASCLLVPRKNQNISSFGNPNSSHPESDEEKNSVDIPRPEFQRVRHIDLLGANASLMFKTKESF